MDLSYKNDTNKKLIIKNFVDNFIEKNDLIDDLLDYLSEKFPSKFKSINLDKKLVFLASPYSSQNRLVSIMRFCKAYQVAISMIKADIPVYSPIAMTGFMPTSEKEDNISSETWIKHSTAVLDYCAAFVILKLPGWESSKGVAKEIEVAKQKNLPIFSIEYFNESDLSLIETQILNLKEHLRKLCNWK